LQRYEPISTNVTHTLLLADDSVTIQRVIELTFADEDVQVVAVSDGDQAIARLESAPPDIVLADIGMPGRNGYEVARYVKQSPKLSHIPVVLLTGAFEPVDQVRATEVGCDGVLAKPFEPQLVIGRVKELLTSETRKSGAPEAAGESARAESARATEEPSGKESPKASTPKEQTPEPAAEVLAHETADLDDYFDKLDVAFAKLSATSPSPQRPKSPELPGETHEVPDVPSAVPAPEIELPLTLASLRSAFEAPAPVAAASPSPSAATPVAVDRAAASTHPLPTIAEAFAAILAAERNASVPAGHAEWPTAFAPPPVEITEQVIDQVTRRVLGELSDKAVREKVAEIVATTAERLVRDEIDRIKAALK
jgi:CheY-like chemotaxis protein